MLRAVDWMLLLTLLQGVVGIGGMLYFRNLWIAAENEVEELDRYALHLETRCEEVAAAYDSIACDFVEVTEWSDEVGAID
jgi:hypothetical protein